MVRSKRWLLSCCFLMTIGLFIFGTSSGFGQAQQSSPPVLVNPVPKEAPSFTERFLQRLTIPDLQKQNIGDSSPAVKAFNVLPRVVVPEPKTCSIPLLP